MRHSKRKQLLALVLALLFVVSLLPAAFADDELPEAEPETPAAQPDKALSYGLKGMPEGYVLSEGQLADRRALIDNEVPAAIAGMTEGTDYVAHELLVSADSEEEARVIAEAYNAELTQFDGGTAVLTLSDISVAEAVAAGLDPESNLPPVEPNYLVYLEPVNYEAVRMPEDGSLASLPGRQSWRDWIDSVADPDEYLCWPEQINNYQYGHEMINSFAAWGVTRGWANIVVAVIDSGVDYNHEDLHDIIKGYDYVGKDADPMDEHGHGTHCAGIIAAKMGNAVGGAGVAPNTTVMAVRVADSKGSITKANSISGIRYAADHGADIANMSYGGPIYSANEKKAVDYAIGKGVTLIAAMGNDGTNIKSYPAAYDGVIAVAAVNPSGERAPYSNYGSWCSVAAPGSDIWSTLPNNNYDAWDGTSMAAPYVSGAAALYMDYISGNPGPAEMKKALLAATNPCSSQGCGKGIIDVSKLLSMSKGAPVFYLRDDGNDTSYFSNKAKTVQVSPESTLSFPSLSQWDQSKVIVYTTDGTTPSIANGEVTNGIEVGALGFSLYLGDMHLSVGDKLTFKALAVSGQGEVSSVTTWTLQIIERQDLNDSLIVTVTAPKTLVPGKSVTLSAAVTASGNTGVNQKVTWSIVSNSGCPNAKIDAKSGKLTTRAGEVGTVTVRATSAANSSKYRNATIQVKQVLPIGVIKLNTASQSLYVGKTAALSITTLQDTQKNDVAIADKSYRWTSSNPKVATVNAAGKVTAVGKGSATVTCEVLDGSGKKATCKITVLQQATSVVITTAQVYAAAGSSTTFKANVLPKTANDRKVVWSLTGAPAGVTVSAAGVVKIPSNVTSGSFTVVAQSHDGVNSGAKATKKITIVGSKASGVKITGYSGHNIPSITVKNGIVSAVTLFSDNRMYDDQEDRITLKATVSNGTKVVWSSSNPKVATVDPDSGLVRAHTAGTVNITCTTQDGSNKKASCKITVINPVSAIYIQSANPGFYQEDSIFLIGIGKTVKNKAVLTNTYGKPTKGKVEWSFRVYNSGGSLGNVDYTEAAKKNNWVKISNAGALTVNKSFYSTWQNAYNKGGMIFIDVNATSTDGSYVSGTTQYIVAPAIESMRALRTSLTLKKSGNESLQGEVVSVYANGGFYNRNYYEVSSSNPDVASAMINSISGNYTDILILAGTKTGTAKITIKAVDGSNKSVTVTVKVTN